MDSRYRVRTIKMSNGSRRAMLCERITGFPVFYPTLYLTTQVYLTGSEYNTQISHLGAIHFLYVWCERNKIHLEKSFAEGVFLNLDQIECLNRDIRYDFKYYLEDPFESIVGKSTTIQKSSSNYRRNRPKRKSNIVVNNKEGTTTIRFIYVRLYLDWLANEFILRTSGRESSHASMLQAKKIMIDAIAAHSPGSSTAELRRGLKREERARFLQIINPEYDDNPFKSDFIKLRNQLICQILFNFGPRRGETLLIKKEDIDWNLGGDYPRLNLRDHPFDPTDTRRVRPQFKTKERQLPVSRNIARLLNNYTRLRDRIPGAKNHGYLIVARDGKPLSISSLDSIFLELSTFEGLPDDLSAHLLRYTWNDMFSEKADQMIASGKWTVDDEKRIRRWHQGWMDDSLMPERYTRRHIEEKANALSIQMQDDIMQDFLIIDPSKLLK
ncbi:hypothetical protein GMSM_05340 [Geomonas sp. Red276]